MQIASYNNTIYNNNNVGLRNDYQNRNVKYNSQDIQQDCFQKTASTANANKVSFGNDTEIINTSIYEILKNSTKITSSGKRCTKYNQEDLLGYLTNFVEGVSRFARVYYNPTSWCWMGVHMVNSIHDVIKYANIYANNKKKVIEILDEMNKNIRQTNEYNIRSYFDDYLEKIKALEK